jgi:hypothetical protein
LDQALNQAHTIQKTHQTQATWDALQTAIQQGAALATDPSATQVEVDAATQAINDAIAALRYNYPVVVQFPTWSGTGTASAQIDADPAKFIRLTLNGTTVPTTAYTLTSQAATAHTVAAQAATSYAAAPGFVTVRPLAAGDTVVTLREAYLKTLTPGVYNFYAEFTDGTSSPLTITITKPTKPNDPDDTLPITGSQSLPTITLLAALLLVMGGTLLRTRPRTRTSPPKQHPNPAAP